jgi:hypothetical protein
MSQDRPSINDILLTVKQFLDDVGPTLQGEAKYHAQVSSYLLGICEREISLASGFETVEQQRLSAFLGEDGALDDLTGKLCAGIRAGEFDDQWDALLDLVLDQTVDKVRIVKPGHLDPMHREKGPQ